MIFRDDGDVTLFIPQPAHALLSGQIAAAWGAEGFWWPEPFAEVVLAAEQHDIGWMPWEAEPTLDPATGRPHEFRQVGAHRHAPMWARGVDLALACWGPWPALLISRHGSLIYTRYADRHRPGSEDALAAERYLEEQGALQARWAGLLGASEAAVEGNGALVAVADALSLAICFGNGTALGPKAGEAPLAGGGTVPLRLDGRPGAGWRLDPWPFREREVTLVCDAARLPRGARWSDEAAMRRDVRAAPRATVRELLRAA